LGRELLKVLMKETEATLRVLDIDENGLNTLREQYGLKRIRPLLGDINNPSRVRLALDGCDTVFHLAALKHLWLGEYNPTAVLDTNVMGTRNLLDASLEEEVDRFITVSSDKAVNPSCFYGQTKAMGEALTLAYNNLKGDRPTKFSVYRPGNFFLSRGNVIERWLKQREAGQPLTVTRGEFTRYFIGTYQAAKMLYKASTLMRGGEVFIPRMKEYKIRELAELFSGHIQFIDPNPHEKTSEELFTKEEGRRIRDLGDLLVIGDGRLDD